MEFLHNDIGSAKDNFKSPIHNWYKFTAGFSHKFVDEIIALENLKRRRNSQIFDPFAGCGTTLVSSQKLGIPAVGNEAQEFMYDIIRAKLNWKLNSDDFQGHLASIKRKMERNISSFDYRNEPHSLLKTLYSRDTLKKLYLIRNAIQSLGSRNYKLFFKLALSQAMHKVCIHPIAIPYIVRAKFLSQPGKPWDTFEDISTRMLLDIADLSEIKKTSRIYLQDSRLESSYVYKGDCNVCITSPPYLNNLDYGEVSKVHSHFFEITDDWSDITKKVRKKLVTGSTTHYTESDFVLDEFRKSDFYLDNKSIGKKLIQTSLQIKNESKDRGSKKSFDILTLLYFKDMYAVLNEIRRVVKKNGKSYLILGDSAPYGIRIPTTELLGKIAKNSGFDTYKIHKIRTRGTKWKSLTHRHSLELTENVLVLG
ncbi:MAG TPA: hypothetical protein VK622_04630 [Puia sp.]|nr:hypothetical protein [Puia sp.]